MAQGDLYLLLPLAWQTYLDHQAEFADYRASYTAQTAADGLALPQTAQALPDDQSRGAAAEKTRRELLPQLSEYLDAWLRLDGYIEETYGETGYKPMREQAGSAFYEAATGENWDATTRLISSARAFVQNHAGELLANDNMPKAFPARLEAEAQDVETLLSRFLQLRKDEQRGTQAKEEANAAAYAAWQKVARDADRIYRRQPDKATYFTTQYLLGIVRGAGQAGLRGTVTLTDGTAAEGVTVTVLGAKDAVAVTDEDGRYAVAVAAGIYTVRFGGGGGYAPVEQAVVVEAGVKKRVDGQVEKLLAN